MAEYSIFYSLHFGQRSFKSYLRPFPNVFNLHCVYIVQSVPLIRIKINIFNTKI